MKLLVITTYPSFGWDFFRPALMKMNNNDPKTLVEPECRPNPIPKKRVIEDRQSKARSNLGKTLAELKNGLYRQERMPED
jgi:hypothetical protein